jgi:beta-fructofuranosidase
VYYHSTDGFDWKLSSVLDRSYNEFGRMWECPDMFPLDGQDVIITSPQDMSALGMEFHSGNGTLALMGQVKDGKFLRDNVQAIDYGLDFYAPQTVEAPDGRRIMIAWMQNWDACDQMGAKERKWFGQMTLPREITIENGRLYQRPVRELLEHRSNKVEYKNVLVDGKLTLEGIEGRTVDLEITIRPKDKEKSFQKFAMWFAQNEQFHTALSFKPYESILKIDRKFSGSRRAFVHQRRAQVKTSDGELKLRVILDRNSAEVFINDGQQTMTTTIMTDLAAQGISFVTDGQVEMDITKYDLFKE